MCNEPEVILENHYGSHQACVFCENYLLNLMEQGLGNDAKVIMDADHAVDVLYNGPDKSELEGLDIANLTERANCAWERILERFVPEEGYHLGYLDHDQALFMIPDGWEDENCD